MRDSANGRPDHRASAYYVYEAPLRLWHWISAICIVTLSVTGYFIGRPLPSVSGEATFLYLMGYIRLTHFIAAYIFSVALLCRIYWCFVGNHYARELFCAPLWSKTWYRNFFDEIRWYLFLEKQPIKYMGHNPVGQLAMVCYFWVAVFMVFTGFALYGEGAGTQSWAYTLFGWVISAFGGNSLDVHNWHRLGMWGILLFVMMHIYTAIREDIMTRQSMISSMVNGYRMFKE